ncbi:hypothetical protein [Aestuariivirga litoralis]|uniref:hypothetical protein n=1 Tax=Aestuariivirga litoralis TaxID=2650924 RepID=UPI0018C6E9DC|nr:hypothetical protein [Aestuariivirga litoralis]MBG1233964.1 hypothetical protein [Aestuariivirga litoralis]
MNFILPPKNFEDGGLESTVGVVESGGQRWIGHDEFASKYRIRESAFDMGKNNEPAANAPDSEPTNRIKTYMAKALENNETQAEQAMSAAGIEISALPISELSHEMAVASIEEGNSEYLDKNADALITASDKAGKCQREEAAFKHLRGLTRASRHAENPLDPAILAFVLVFLEAAGNVFFFAGGYDGGLISAAVLTFTVSIVNVVLLGFFCTGFLGSRLALSSPFPLGRAVGWFFLTAGISVSFVLNLLLAHYRDLAMQAEAVQFSHALPVLLRPWLWLQLNDFMSFALFLVGLGCFLMGAWKGRYAYDSVWGFATVARAARESEEARDELRDKLKAQVHERVNQVKAKIQTAHEADAATMQKHRETLARTERRVSDLERARLTIEKGCHRLWAEVFEIIRRIRGQDIVLPEWTMHPPKLEAPGKDFESRMVVLRDMVAAAEATHKNNYQEVLAFSKALPRLREKVTQDFLAKIAECERRGDGYAQVKVQS